MAKVKLAAVLFALALAGLVSGPPAFVQAEQDINILAGKHENRFPTDIRFSVEATSASPITRVTLRYRAGYSLSTGFGTAEFTPGTSVKAQYTWNTQRQYLPPGMDIQYYWQVEDAAGHNAQTSPTVFTVDDTRFQWMNVRADKLTLYWYRGDGRFAQELLDAGTEALTRLTDEVGAQLDHPVKVFIYATQPDLLGALPPRGVEWTGGQAFPDANIIVLTAAPNTSGREYGLRTIAHELTHLVVHAATDNPYGGVPQWLDEGLAMYSEGDLPAEYDSLLKRSVANGSLLNLKSLSGNFPTDPQQSLLGYVESHSVVKYMLSKYGREKMSTLLAIFHEGSTVQDAIRGAYGMTLSDLETEWRASIGAPPPRPAASSATAVRGTPLLSPTHVAAPTATALTSAQPSATPTTPASSGGSCFGGFLLLGGALGVVCMVANRRSWRS